MTHQNHSSDKSNRPLSAVHITDHINAIPQKMEFGDAASIINPSIIETDTGIILVDAGMPGMEQDIEASLNQAGYELSDIEILLLTHQDIDHTGAAAAIIEASGAQVLIHQAGASYVDGRKRPIKLGNRDIKWTPFPIDRELSDGARLPFRGGELEIIHTPGHTPGHISIYDEHNRALLAGDALVAADGELYGPREEVTPDMDQAIASVNKLGDYAIERVLCYHGGLVDVDSRKIRELGAKLSSD